MPRPIDLPRAPGIGRDRPAEPPPGFDADKTLQVDPDADPEVVQAGYRRLALKFHPDVASGAETAARPGDAGRGDAGRDAGPADLAPGIVAPVMPAAVMPAR